MSLKLIPVEKVASTSPAGNKSFNPGSTIKKKLPKDTSLLKKICLQLIHYINRGSSFTSNQIDELILSLHQSILRLQRKKHELLKEKHGRMRRNSK